MQQNRSAVRLDDMNRKKLEQSTDGELVDLAKQAAGQGAYAELVKRHHDRCLRRASSILSEPADAEDAVQEAFIRALLKLDQLEDPERFPGWLDRIVVSLAVSRRRQHQPGSVNRPAYEAALDRLEDEDGNPERQAIAEEREEAVAEAIGKLPEKYGDPLRRFHLNGQSYKHIAEALDLPLGTVQSLISRARDKLETLLKPYYWTPMHPS